MNKYLKSFLHRGLIFGGFGPIVAGAVYLFVEMFHSAISLNATQVFLAVVSTYLLAFIQAGASVFNQIDHWPLPKSLLCHFSSIYFAYLLCYIINSWIPFKSGIVLIFTGFFIATYFVIWTAMYFSVKSASKKMNNKLN
ncbi:MAG: DUF3021 domain-containing protein [Clostridia bacterium]|nr:DUF3021 domain-containing protein [Clostridia bacterium]